MSAEARMRIELEEFAWGAVREAERPTRGKVSVLLGDGGRLLGCRNNRLTLEPVEATTMGRCTRFDPEVAEEMAEALSKKTGSKLVAVDLYDFAKARQYVERARLARLKEAAK